VPKRRSCGRSSTLNHRRQGGLAAGEANGRILSAAPVMRDVQTGGVSKLFDTLAPRFASRPGGYTRLLRSATAKATAPRSRKWRVGSEYDPKAKAENPAKDEARSQRQGRSVDG